MESYLYKYGLWAVFFGSAVEADAIPVVSGAVSHSGAFGFSLTLLVCVGGMFAGDCAWYMAGRLFGNSIKKISLVERRFPRIEAFIDRFGLWQLLIARILYGTRNATMMIWGIRKSSFIRFAAIDLLGCAVWGTFLVSLGYFMSFSLNRIVGDIKQTEIILLVVAVFAVVIVVLRRTIQKKRIIT